MPLDGSIDLKTLEQLNVPLSFRIAQIRLALERYRWLRYDFPQPPIVVNIPAFRLYAFDEEGGIGLTMRVDVGGEDFASTRTPILEDEMEYLVFRPYWEVPFSIERDEVIPNARDDPSYLSDEHFEIVAPSGQVYRIERSQEKSSIRLALASSASARSRGQRTHWGW